MYPVFMGMPGESYRKQLWTHTRTHTHTHTHTNANKHTYSQTHKYANTHIHIQKYANTYTHTHTKDQKYTGKSPTARAQGEKRNLPGTWVHFHDGEVTAVPLNLVHYEVKVLDGVRLTVIHVCQLGLLQQMWVLHIHCGGQLCNKHNQIQSKLKLDKPTSFNYLLSLHYHSFYIFPQ